MGNAVKFTETGSVVLETKVRKIEGKDVEIQFSVTDTGVGVPEDAQQKIFESFSQEDSSNTRKYGGSGLGLAISRKLAEAMQGSIQVESRRGVGSRFVVTIPFGKAVDG